jgi:hypothetical protein
LFSQLDLKHPLVRLAELIDWERFETAFGGITVPNETNGSPLHVR